MNDIALVASAPLKVTCCTYRQDEFHQMRCNHRENALNAIYKSWSRHLHIWIQYLEISRQLQTLGSNQNLQALPWSDHGGFRIDAQDQLQFCRSFLEGQFSLFGKGLLFMAFESPASSPSAQRSWGLNCVLSWIDRRFKPAAPIYGHWQFNVVLHNVVPQDGSCKHRNWSPASFEPTSTALSSNASISDDLTSAALIGALLECTASSHRSKWSTDWDSRHVCNEQGFI